MHSQNLFFFLCSCWVSPHKGSCGVAVKDQIGIQLRFYCWHFLQPGKIASLFPLACLPHFATTSRRHQEQHFHNDYVTSSVYITWNDDEWWLMMNWRKYENKAVMALCKVFSQNLYWMTEENHYKPHHESRCFTWDLNHVPPAKKEESLPLYPICPTNNSTNNNINKLKRAQTFMKNSLSVIWSRTSLPFMEHECLLSRSVNPPPPLDRIQS
jgi:hypothetical protein